MTRTKQIARKSNDCKAPYKSVPLITIEVPDVAKTSVEPVKVLTHSSIALRNMWGDTDLWSKHRGAIQGTSRVMEVLRMSDVWDLPDDVTDIILRHVFALPKPTLNRYGYVVTWVKNVWSCHHDIVLEHVEDRVRWQQLAKIPGLNAYERRVSIWKSEYYDRCMIYGGIKGLHRWSGGGGGDGLSVFKNTQLKSDTDRRSAEWIGFRQWVQTHPVYKSQDSGWLYAYRKRSPKMLTHYWYKYELALAYPTLYGKRGWANKKLPNP